MEPHGNTTSIKHEVEGIVKAVILYLHPSSRCGQCMYSEQHGVGIYPSHVALYLLNPHPVRVALLIRGAAPQLDFDISHA